MDAQTNQTAEKINKTNWIPTPHHWQADLGYGLTIQITDIIPKEIDCGGGMDDCEHLRERWALTRNGEILRTIEADGHEQIKTALDLLHPEYELSMYVDDEGILAIYYEALRSCPNTKKEGLEGIARLTYETGNALNYILTSCKKYHVGDTPVMTAMILTEAAKKVINSKGIHIAVCGNAGTGKSHAAATVARHIPAVVSGSFSSKGLLYNPIAAGSTVIVDDQELTEEFQELMKKATTDWRKTIMHRTVSKTKGMILELPPRCSYWIIKANLTGDEQTLDRCLLFWIDNSDEQKKAVQEAILKEAMQAEETIEGIEEIQICNMIWGYVEAQAVTIPFADKIQCDIDMDPRNINLMIELTKAHAILSGAKRERDESRAVIATMEDFIATAKLINPILENKGGGQKLKLSKTEGKILEFLQTCETGDIPFTTIRTGTKLSAGTISIALTGRQRNDIEHQGLIDKCPAIDVVKTANQIDGRTVYSKAVRWNRELYAMWYEGAGLFFIDAEKK